MMFKKAVLALTFLFGALLVTAGFAGTDVNTVGVHGYDLVAYQTENKPVPGDGNNAVAHDGVTYLFASEANKKTFAANPEKYLPAYGGYCAYGVSVSKKFDGNPLIWKVVDGKLYLNLDKKIQTLWNKDVAGNIKKADENWPQIKDKLASEL